MNGTNSTVNESDLAIANGRVCMWCEVQVYSSDGARGRIKKRRLPYAVGIVVELLERRTHMSVGTGLGGIVVTDPMFAAPIVYGNGLLPTPPQASQASYSPMPLQGLTASVVCEPEATGAESTSVVATFWDRDESAAAGDYTATISWGDGSTSTGTVTAVANPDPEDDPGYSFNVSGTLPYSQPGNYNVSVTITKTGGNVSDWSGGAPLSVTTTGKQIVLATPLAEPPATAPGATPGMTAQFRQEPLNPGDATPTMVATFTDTDMNATAGDYTATINWGDGSTSAGTIVQPWWPGFGPQTFQVMGAPPYIQAGYYNSTVTITKISGSDNGSATGLPLTMTVAGFQGIMPNQADVAVTYVDQTLPADSVADSIPPVSVADSSPPMVFAANAPAVVLDGDSTPAVGNGGDTTPAEAGVSILGSLGGDVLITDQDIMA